MTTHHEMSGSRKWRGALACVLWASVVACFLTTETARNPPRSLKLRGLPPRADAGETNSFWVALQKAANRNKTDAQTYVERIIAHAKNHVNSSKVVDRDDAIQALVRSMKTPELLLVLGGKHLGKTFLKGEAIKRCKETERNIDIVSVDMRDGDMSGKPLMAALDLQRQKSLKWSTRAMEVLGAVIRPLSWGREYSGAEKAAKGVLDVVVQAKQILHS